MKICKECLQSKKLSEFYKHKGCKDGHINICKICSVKKVVEWQKTKRGKQLLLQKQRRYRLTNKGKETSDRYTKSVKGRKNSRKQRKITYKKNKLADIMSVRIRQSLKSGKDGESWQNLVDYNLNELKRHLEKQFKPGMSWNNHGMKGWHIDHIKPVSLFNITSYICNDFKICWSLNNLQPLWWAENLKKSNKYIKKYKYDIEGVNFKHGR